MADNAEQDRSSEEAPARPGERLAAKKAAKAAQKAAKRGRQAEQRETDAIRASAKAADWLRANRRAWFLAMAGIIVAGGSAVGYLTVSANQDREATGLLWEASRAAASPLEGEAGAATAEETFASVQARAEAAAERFGRVLEEHPRSRAAAWARVGRANALLQAGEADRAVKAFEEALEAADGTTLRWRALEGLGFAHEAAERWAEATKQYEAMEKLGDESIALEARYHLARIQLAQGKEDDALGALKKLRDALRGDDAPRLPFLSDQVDQLIRRIDPQAIPAGSGTGGGSLSPQEMQELLRRLQESGGGGGLE
jgi:tetratricopeptide (TPR) repeat protein